MSKEEPSKAQKKQFKKGFKWGRIEHKLETYTTYALFIGIFIQIIGKLSKRWDFITIATLVFCTAFLFRFLAGIAHKMEKHYNDKLRYGKWRNEK